MKNLIYTVIVLTLGFSLGHAQIKPTECPGISGHLQVTYPDDCVVKAKFIDYDGNESLTYVWRLDDQVIPGEIASVIYLDFTENGNFDIRVTVTNPSIPCSKSFSDTLTLTDCEDDDCQNPPCNPPGCNYSCPPASCLDIITQPSLYCHEAQAWLNCGNPCIDYVEWYYSIGPYYHQYAGTSGGNANGQHAQAIYLPYPAPNGTWEGYNLVVYANVVFDNGTECQEIYTMETLQDCAFGDGGAKEAVNKPSITIYPNPAKSNSQLAIISPEDIDVKSVAIYDISGNLKLKPELNQKSFDVGKLIPGFYIVKLVTENGMVQKKIIIE